MDRCIVKPVESAISSLPDAGVVAAVRAWTDVVDHAHQSVLHRDALGGRPAHVVRDVDLSCQGDWPPILASHQVEPLQLDAEHQGRALYLVLLGCWHLLLTLLTLVHIFALTQILPPKVALQCRVNVVRLPNVQQEVHEVLEGGRNVSASHAGDVLPHVPTKDLIEGGGLFGVVIHQDILRELPRDQVALLQAFHQIPQKLMCVFLPAVGEVLADELQLLVDLHRLDDIGVGGVAQGGRHEANGARVLTPKVARILMASVSQVVHKGRGMEQRLCGEVSLQVYQVKHIEQFGFGNFDKHIVQFEQTLLQIFPATLQFGNLKC